jgi:low affinity Fe/Cu permease
LESINAFKVNLIAIAIWAVTGKLLILLAFDSVLPALAVTLLVGAPYVWFVNKYCVRYRLADTTKPGDRE